jgi:hypothetical protein
LFYRRRALLVVAAAEVVCPACIAVQEDLSLDFHCVEIGLTDVNSEGEVPHRIATLAGEHTTDKRAHQRVGNGTALDFVLDTQSFANPSLPPAMGVENLVQLTRPSEDADE